MQRLGLSTITITLLWAVIALYPAQAGAPDNPVTLPLEDRIDARSVAPQGWAFFTRNPREDNILPFARTSTGQWEGIHVGPHARPRHAFGLNRASRAQGVEVGLLYVVPDEDDWHDCDDEPAQCLEALPVAQRTVNESPSPTLCGHVALVRQPPAPWAWSVDGDPPSMPSQAVRMEVSCS